MNKRKILIKYKPKASSRARRHKFTVYILHTSSNTLYIGQTSDLERRLKEHKSKGSRAARYIRYFDSFELVHQENFSTRSEAMHREAQLKSWPRAKKDLLLRHAIVQNETKK